MNYLVINTNMFNANQLIQVYNEKGECIQALSTSIDELVDYVKGLKGTYNIKNIKMYGCTPYLTRFASEIKTEFGNDHCDIEVIEK